MTNDIILNNLSFSWQYFTWAAAIGAMSALSLPLGTLVGLTLKPKKNVTGALAAYGSGALGLKNGNGYLTKKDFKEI